MKANYDMLAETCRRVVRNWPAETVAEFHERAAMFEEAGNARTKAEFLAFWNVRRRRDRGDLP